MVTTRGAPLRAAAATLVADAPSRCRTLERWLVRRRRHELAWTISLVMFAVASAALWLAEAGGWSAPTLPRLLPVRRHPQRAVAGPRDRLPAGRTAPRRRRAVGPRRRCPASRPASWSPPRCRPRARRRAARGHATCSAPLPRILAAVGSGVAAVVVIGGALVVGVAAVAPRRPAGSRADVLAAAPRPRQRADRRRHPRALGQRHARRPARARTRRSPSRSLVGIVVLFVGFLVATPGTCSRADGDRADTARPRARPGGALGLRPAPSAQGAAQDLAGEVPGQLVDEHHLGRALVAGQVVAGSG